MKAVEKYYTILETATLLSVCGTTIRRRLTEGCFPGAVDLGHERAHDYRIPASAINGFLAARAVFTVDPGLAARSVGELRRKAQRVPTPGL